MKTWPTVSIALLASCMANAACSAVEPGSCTYNVISFGAKGDGIAKDTAAIQRALNACEKTGGSVVVPPGTYLTGSIYLGDNTELHLAEGATILGSPDLDDYNAPDAYPQNWGSAGEGWSAKHLILAWEKRKVSISGKGAIDGNGRSFFDDRPSSFGKICWRRGGINARGSRAEQRRPGQEIVFIECRGVSVRDVMFRDMSCWSCFFHGCEDVTVGGVTVRNGLCNLNTDGFDVDSCRNVQIGDCDIVTGDDAIAIRGNPARLKDAAKVCENVRVSNIVCRVSADGVRVGVGNGTIRNVRVSNMTIMESGRGLHVQCCYGAPKTGGKVGVDISDVMFENVTICDTCEPVCVVGGASASTAKLSNITFRNVRSTAFSVVSVVGAGGTRPADIYFKDCLFKLDGATGKVFFDRESGGGDLADVGAFRIGHAGKVSFRRCSLVWGDNASNGLVRAFAVWDAPPPDVDSQSSIEARGCFVPAGDNAMCGREGEDGR